MGFYSKKSGAIISIVSAIVLGVITILKLDTPIIYKTFGINLLVTLMLFVLLLIYIDHRFEEVKKS